MATNSRSPRKRQTRSARKSEAPKTEKKTVSPVKRTCFVIMPFSPTKSCNDWDTVYDNLIAPAIRGSGLGYTPERSQIRTGAFISDILSQLNTARVVVADLTDMNPNVFYELGVRHTLKNRTILICQDLKHVPSDLRAYGVVEYAPDLKGLPEFRKRLRLLFHQIEDQPERPDNPVADYIKNRAYLLYERERLDAVRRLKSLHAELFDSMGIMGFNLKEYDNAKWQISPFTIPCLQEILTTQYVNLSVREFGLFRRLSLNFADLDFLGKQCMIHSYQWRMAKKQYYFSLASRAHELLGKVVDVVQSRIRYLENEDYAEEPPNPVQRAEIWEVFVAKMEEEDKAVTSKKTEKRKPRKANRSRTAKKN